MIYKRLKQRIFVNSQDNKFVQCVSSSSLKLLIIKLFSTMLTIIHLKESITINDSAQIVTIATAIHCNTRHND